MSRDNDQQLLRRIRRDPQAFGLVYDDHYNSIFSYAFRRLANYEAARDITAETFFKAYQKIGSFQWRNVPISAWLFRIASNEINLYFRNSKYRPTCIDDLNLHLHIAYEPGIETEKAAAEKALCENQEFIQLHQHLLRLGTKYQEVIALRYFEQKSIKEIATIVKKKEGTVKSLLSRGLDKLRTAIEDSSVRQTAKQKMQLFSIFEL